MSHWLIQSRERERWQREDTSKDYAELRETSARFLAICDRFWVELFSIGTWNPMFPLQSTVIESRAFWPLLDLNWVNLRHRWSGQRTLYPTRLKERIKEKPGANQIWWTTRAGQPLKPPEKGHCALSLPQDSASTAANIYALRERKRGGGVGSPFK